MSIDTARSSGEVVRIAGPVIVAVGLDRTRLYNVVRVGRRRLIGEVIQLKGDEAVIQVYEDTSGLQVGSEVVDTGAAMDVELGPGLIGNIFDGVQRPLPDLARSGDDPYARPFIRRGLEIPALDHERVWDVTFTADVGDAVQPGDILATVQETQAVLHRILLPSGRSGTVTRLGDSPLRIDDPLVWVDETPVTMVSRWPVRLRRPFAERLDPIAPLVTGQRVVDMLFPLARGGSATIPGGFGTGKTVHEQTLAKWCDADVIVYIGCGERGNELAEVLEEFPRLIDPRSGASLMERTILIANTSNMPVAAREASIYTGITLGEYYRDQGYDVALMADSTSRWGEALREVSSRLEEMPGEEGYPAYLPSRLAEFYERAGSAIALGKDRRRGSVSVVGAVSPAGGDFSEPVTQYSLRLAGTFWALDSDLARRRHYPAIHWTRSYSLYDMDAWFDEAVAGDWSEHRRWAVELLGQEEELQSIVQLLGLDVLAPAEQLTVAIGRVLREDYLQQSAFSDVDAFCPLEKQYWMLRVIRLAFAVMRETVERGVEVGTVLGVPAMADVARMKLWKADGAAELARDLITRIEGEVDAL